MCIYTPRCDLQLGLEITELYKEVIHCACVNKVEFQKEKKNVVTSSVTRQNATVEAWRLAPGTYHSFTDNDKCNSYH